MLDILQSINEVAWVVGNLLIAYIAIGVIVFVISYFIFFDPRATTAGKLIFRFFVSLVGIVMLIFVGTYIDPAADRMWLVLPPDVDDWRPLLRVLIYGYVAYTVTSLAILLAIRKWRPAKVHSQRDLDIVKLRNTSEIPIIRPE